MRLMSALLLVLSATGASVAWGALVVTAVGPMSRLRQEVVRQTWRDAPEIDHDLPVSLTCPITTELLRYPVVASDGITYEWSAVKKWCLTRESPGCESPITREPLRSTVIVNADLADIIGRWPAYRDALYRGQLPVVLGKWLDNTPWISPDSAHSFVTGRLTTPLDGNCYENKALKCVAEEVVQKWSVDRHINRTHVYTPQLGMDVDEEFYVRLHDRLGQRPPTCRCVANLWAWLTGRPPEPSPDIPGLHTD
ncbi:U-box domain-containing protein [Plasmodiophora brassicae]